MPIRSYLSNCKFKITLKICQILVVFQKVEGKPLPYNIEFKNCTYIQAKLIYNSFKELVNFDTVEIMAIWVVEFSNGGNKIRNIFA
jgi:hypothetical protein